MNQGACTLVEEARLDGLILTATPSGTLRVRGPKPILAKWTTALQGHKAEVLAALTSSQALTATQPDTEAEKRAIEYCERVAKDREAGRVPASYISTTHCRGCGTVPIFAGAPARVDSCPWCSNRSRGLPIPRPLVSCVTCQHFTADPIGDGGIGSCARGGPPKGQMPAYPYAKRKCGDFEPKETAQ